HDDGPNEADPVDLVVTFKSNQDPAKKQTILSPTAGETVFPLAGARTTVFSIIANGREGPAQITVAARGPEEHTVGLGQTTATLVPHNLPNADVTLRPTDFQINTEFPNSQIFTTGPTARQVAADAKGNFIVTWEDLECGGGGRCDIFARLFDARAKARLSGSRGDKKEFRANPTNSFYDYPAVAMKANGAYMLAASTQSTQTSPLHVVVRPFLADGKPNPAVSDEVTVNTGTLDAVNPDVAVLTDGSSVVCWTEDFKDQGTKSYKVLCRLFDDNATPLPGAGGLREPFTATTVSPSNVVAKLVSVAVAAGPKNSFMVVWADRCSTGANCWNVRGRIYSDTAKSFTTIIDISTPKTNKTGALDVAGLPYGYLVAWTDQISGNPADGTDILARRFGDKGVPLEDPFRLNTSVSDNQRVPAIAVLPTGQILVAWETQDNSQDPGGGIRGRILLGNGLPVGNDFALNTTIAGTQDSPSLAPISQDAFIVVFRDGSKLGRDKIETGIRGRLIYPEYRPTGGGVGFLCTPSEAGSCGSGLRCQIVTTPEKAAGEPRCINTCKEHGACVNGGRCLKLAGNSQFVCIYQDR
ncbi:MAG: hypothetical protein KAI47_00875, partial [Deltaproteobacteria bacterium]|nr:hypothetical protein [Deltaproteobacteria bacterium]